MKLKVDESLCISCGYCVGVCPEVFEFSDDGPSHVKVDTIPDNLKDTAVEAKEGCPTEAIKEVDD